MTTTLKIYRAPSGQWSGIILVDGDEIGRIAGCIDAADVESFAYEQGHEIDIIETV